MDLALGVIGSSEQVSPPMRLWSCEDGSRRTVFLGRGSCLGEGEGALHVEAGAREGRAWFLRFFWSVLPAGEESLHPLWAWLHDF